MNAQRDPAISGNRRFATSAFTVLLGAHAAGQAQVLSELHREAVLLNLAVVGAQAQVQAAEPGVLQARGVLGPNAAINNNNSEARYREGPAFNLMLLSGKQAELQVTQPVFKLALLSILEVSQLKERDTIALMQAQKRAAGEQLAAARKVFTLGRSSIVDVREAEAKIQDLRRQLLAELVGRQAPELLGLGLAGDQVPSLQTSSVQVWIADGQLGSAQRQQAPRALDTAVAGPPKHE